MSSNKQMTLIWVGVGFYLFSGEGACGVSCVPMREQKKTMRKVTFVRAGQCAALSSFRVGKMLFLYEKGMFLTSWLKRCDKGCLVITELRKMQYFSYVYCISAIYKSCRSIRLYAF